MKDEIDTLFQAIGLVYNKLIDTYSFGILVSMANNTREIRQYVSPTLDEYED